MMKNRCGVGLVIGAWLAGGPAALGYQAVRISEIHSSTCGLVAYLELEIPAGHGDVAGRELRVFDRNGLEVLNLAFSSNVATPSRLLVGTDRVATVASVSPDLVIGSLQPGDLDPVGGALWFGCCGGDEQIDVVVYGDYVGPLPPTGTQFVSEMVLQGLPTDGRSLVRGPHVFEVGESTPTNLAGQTGSVPPTGDVNGDGLVTPTDGTALVQVLIGQNVDPGRSLRSDLDCSGQVNGLDIAAFVDVLLSPETPEERCESVTLAYSSVSYDELASILPLAGPPPTQSFLVWGIASLDVPRAAVMHVSGRLFATRDDGCTWTQIGTTDPFGLYRIEPGPNGYAYAWEDNGSSGGSRDGGIFRIRNYPRLSANWQVDHFTAPVPSMHGFGVDPHDPLHVRTADDEGLLYESWDGGGRWSPMGSPASPGSFLSYVIEFDPSDIDHAIFGRSSEGGFVTFDAGRTWQSCGGLRSLPNRGSNFFAATISPLDGNTVYAMAIDLGQTGLPGDPPPPPSNGRHIYASTDGGLTFAAVLSEGTGGGEPGEGVFMQNGPVMKSSWTDPNVFYYLFSVACVNGPSYLYEYDGSTATLTTHVANPDEEHCYLPRTRAFEFSRTDSESLLLGFEFRGAP